MKLIMKQTLIAIALAGAVGSAQAATVSLSGGSFPYDLGVDPTDANAYSVTHEVGSFSDIFTFSLTSSASDTISSAVALLLPDFEGGSSYEVTNGSLTLFSDPDSDGAGGVNVQLGTTGFGSTNGVLTYDGAAAGSYFWAVAGDAVGSQGGIYQFAANTVPEPETYALMLAGLGLIGFIGRRRLSQGASELFARNSAGMGFA